MSEKNNKKRRKENLLTYDLTVENPEDIIAADKDENRRQAFREAYKVIAKIIPEYFMTQRKKRKNSSSGGGGTSFSQNIVVTADKATVQTKEVVESTKENDKQEERERE